MTEKKLDDLLNTRRNISFLEHDVKRVRGLVDDAKANLAKSNFVTRTDKGGYVYIQLEIPEQHKKEMLKRLIELLEWDVFNLESELEKDIHKIKIA